jgi:Protein of unknown function (DUF1565)
MFARLLMFIVVAAYSCEAYGGTYYVDPIRGDDSSAGSQADPFRSIAQAMKKVDGPGGKVSLSPGCYTEQIMIHKGGQADNPLVIEGNGAVINLGVDVTDGPWVKTDNGYLLDQPVHKNTRYYLTSPVFINGLPVSCDRPKGGVKPAWHGGSCRYDDQNHLVIVFPRGLSPTNSVVVLTGAPGFFSSGVQVSGGSHIHIYDLVSVFSGNDGFNLHGNGSDVLIQRCKALFNGDNGISSHETYHVDVRDSEVAFGGTMGGAIDDIMQTVTTYTNVRVHQCRAAAFILIGKSHHLDHVVSFSNGDGNLPKASDKIELSDCTELAPVESDAQIPMVDHPDTNTFSTQHVEETDRLGRFLQLRPPITTVPLTAAGSQ